MKRLHANAVAPPLSRPVLARQGGGFRSRATHSIILLILICIGISSALAQVGTIPRTHSQLPAAPQATIRDATFQSASLGRTMKYRIILPAGYDRGARRYPVLYLLHGLIGSYLDWDTKTHLEEYAAPLRLIIVMPDAGDSWYTNSSANPRDRFEDYIFKDLLAEIDKTYRTIATRHARAIGGLSMGGYGAMKFALKYPNLFVFAGSFSGVQSVAHDPDLKLRAGEKYDRQALEIYGPPRGATRTANDVFALAEKTDPADLPYFWITCGIGDRRLESNREFVALLQRRNIAYTYEEAPGSHSWAFWDEELPAMLRELSRHMELGTARPVLPPIMPARQNPSPLHRP
ncbi:MAG: esterase family protein [Acidobacteriia bacterium]|nr:esterase family protein [Terriglobia bacterium]